MRIMRVYFSEHMFCADKQRNYDTEMEFFRQFDE